MVWSGGKGAGGFWRPSDEDGDGYPRWLYGGLSADEIERLRQLAAAYLARSGLIEHFSDREIERLRFQRWLRETGQLTEGEGV